MARRGESIFKRKDGRWEARYICCYEDGKAKYRYIYGDSYAEAKQKRNAELANASEAVMPVSKPQITMDELSGLWLTDIRASVKESTYSRYFRTVNKYISPKLGKLKVFKLDAHVINRYSEGLLNGGGLRGQSLSAKTVTDILCVIQSIFKFGRVFGYPCSDLWRVSATRRNPVTM